MRVMATETAALCEEGVCQILSCQQVVNKDLLVQGICVKCRSESILYDLNARNLVSDEGVVIGGEGSEDEVDDAASNSDDEGGELVSDEDDDYDQVEDLSGDYHDSDQDDTDSARLVSNLFLFSLHKCFVSFAFDVCNILNYVLY